MPAALAPFDPLRQFKAITNFLYSGDRYMRGDPFPNPGIEVPALKLKQLYTIRKISYVEDETRRDYPEKPPKDRGVEPEAPARTHEKLDEADELEAQAQKLSNSSTHTELFNKASGLAGVTKSLRKIDIARVLIKAGRAGDGGDS